MGKCPGTCTQKLLWLTGWQPERGHGTAEMLVKAQTRGGIDIMVKAGLCCLNVLRFLPMLLLTIGGEIRHPYRRHCQTAPRHATSTTHVMANWQHKSSPSFFPVFVIRLHDNHSVGGLLSVNRVKPETVGLHRGNVRTDKYNRKFLLIYF